jgi:hypothetical protein
MKVILKESQIEKMVFRYLDNKNFHIVKSEKKLNIYFLENESDELAQIKYWVWANDIVIYSELTDEISSMFSLDKDDAEYVIAEWTCNKLDKSMRNIGIRTLGGIMADANLIIE